MKLIHLGDLHLGKKVFGYDLMDEQRDALEQVLQTADSFQVDGVMICGDVYDTAVPSVEAVGLLDWFLDELHTRELPVYIISGNHDSAGRLNFGSALLEASDVHIASLYDGRIPHFDLSRPNPDSPGKEERIRLHLLPFIKPVKVRAALDASCTDWSEAAALALSQAELLEDGVNILLSHQFYTGAKSCESEQLAIGNLDQISTDVLEPFDYCALGHLHTPQSVKKETIRYCGSLLKFSASELDSPKTITVVETGPDRTVSVHEVPVQPKRDFVRIQGTFDRLVSEAFYRTQNPDNYFYIVLDDEEEVFQVFEKLQVRYPRILKVEYSRRRQQSEADEAEDLQTQMKKPEDIFEEFYRKQNDRDLDASMKDLLHELWEASHEAD